MGNMIQLCRDLMLKKENLEQKVTKVSQIFVLPV